MEVLPVRWSLTRAPEGPLAGLSATAEEKARATYTELHAASDRRFRPPIGWALPEEPDFAATQQFGPLTPLVLARAAVLWQADRDRLHKLIVVAIQADGAGSLTEPIAVARAVARPVGRSAALDAVESVVQQLAADRMCDSRFATCWHEAVAGVLGQELLRSPPAERHRIERNLRGLLVDVLHACCAVQAVDDVIDAPARLAGLGPWLALTAPDGVAPDADWRAAPEVLDVVRQLLSGLSDAELDRIMHAHSAVLIGLPGFTTRGEEYADVEALLSGWALTSAAACPDLGRLLGRKRAHRDGLALWASCLTAALTFRARLSADQVSAFCEPFRQLLPDLEPTLNAVH